MTMETPNSLLKKLGLLGVSWSAGWIHFRATSQSWLFTSSSSSQGCSASPVFGVAEMDGVTLAGT